MAGEKRNKISRYHRQSLIPLVFTVLFLVSAAFLAGCAGRDTGLLSEAGASPAGDETAKTASAGQPGSEAILSYSTFDGGESIYKITIEDPSIVTCDGGQGYNGPGQSLVTGVGYRDYYIFVGLKPGTTTVTATANSLISGNYDIHYIVTVDENLKVTLRRTQSISGFDLLRSNEKGSCRYQIITLNTDYYLSLNEGMYKKIGRDTVDALYQACEENGVFLWNGFSGEDEDAAADSSANTAGSEDAGAASDTAFGLSITLTDGTVIRAEGNGSFPANYSTAAGAMEAVLKNADYQRMLSITGLLDWFTSDPKSDW